MENGNLGFPQREIFRLADKCDDPLRGIEWMGL